MKSQISTDIFSIIQFIRDQNELFFCSAEACAYYGEV